MFLISSYYYFLSFNIDYPFKLPTLIMIPTPPHIETYCGKDHFGATPVGNIKTLITFATLAFCSWYSKHLSCIS